MFIPKNWFVRKNDITNILGSIDKKMEINKKKIARLESIAQDIYNYWFVQYEFPDETGKPYKSNGGKLVWNEELKRNIPVGWTVGKVADCISKISTGLNPRDNFVLNENGTNDYVTVKNLMENGSIDFSNCDKISNRALEIIHKRSDIQSGDILFGSIAPLGRVYYIIESPKNWEINESIFSIRTNKNIMPPCFMYLFLRHSSTKKKMEHSSFGSIFKGIRIGVINKIEIVIPPISLLNNFEKTIVPLLRKRHFAEQELQVLNNQKQQILPMLMNEQVTIK